MSSQRNRAVQWVLAGALFAGCKSVPAYVETFRAGDLPAAQVGADEAVAEKAKVSVERVAGAQSRGPDFKVDDGDLALACLDKAMISLAQGDAKTALEWMRPVRETLDDNYVDSLAEYIGSPESIAAGDAADEYRAADYEHVMVYVMLSICDLLAQQQDHMAYAEQVGLTQEYILGSDFDGLEEKPRSSYQRIAMGAWLQGTIREGDLNTSDARVAFARANEYQPGSGIIEASLQRTTDGDFAPEGHGAVHVIYLGGVGPSRGQDDFDLQVEAVRATALIVLGLLKQSDFEEALVSALQDTAPMPTVVIETPDVPALRVAANGAVFETETMLDVNEVAQQQMEANRTMLMVRMAVRRVMKAALAPEVDEGILGGALNFGSTALEEADKRCWATLPAQIQVARLTMPEGVHALTVGADTKVELKVKAMRDSYVVVVQHHLDQPPVALVDLHSQVTTAN